MADPVGYLLTWTCYGTWLPGDARGCVDIRHNTPGEPLAPPNAWRQRCNALRLRHAPVRLAAPQRRIVRHAIEDHCEVRRWALHAVSVRSNHVHAVVSCPVAPDIARDQFKAWATRRLRASGHFPRPMIVWTEDGSSRYLWNAADLQAAIRYVGEEQGPEID